MLDHIFAFGLEWGLSVNIKKTAVLVFNKSGRLLKESTGFFHGDTRISERMSYYYYYYYFFFFFFFFFFFLFFSFFLLIFRG